MSSKLSSTVGTWLLKPTTTTPAENSFTVGLSPEGNETALRDDSRQLVDPKDIRPGGKYYSILKLQIKYEKQDASDNRWAQGSGWLIKPDLLVTAGHCAYDHTYGLGRAAEVKVYTGYAGKESIGKPGVQFRHGTRVMAPLGWLQSDANRQNDVSFIQLDKPFDNVTPIKYQPTPSTGKLTLGVVGYPADKTYKDEAAARMYAQFKTVSIDLESTFLHMLEYTISSYGGQSGSPVIIQNQNAAVGTHVYGLGDKNSASVIRGKYGNFYRSYENAFAGCITAPASAQRWTVLDLPAAEDALTDPPLNESENFWRTLKKVVNVGAKIGSSILTVGSPFLGPIGGPIAAVAGVALRVAGKATETSVDGESSIDGESALPTGVAHKQYLCRAILSEAALQAVLKMDAETANKYGLFNNMQKFWTQHKVGVRYGAKLIGPSLIVPATRIALNSTEPATATVTPWPVLPRPVGSEASLDDEQERFVNALEEAAQTGTEAEGEGFFSFLRPLIRTAIKVAPSVIKAISGEAALEDEAAVVDSESALGGFEAELQPHVETLCHRALMAEAALQAIMSIPPEQLQQESIFSNIISAIKKIGTTAVKVAPSVIRVVEPIVHQIVQDKLNGKKGAESSLDPSTGGKNRSVDDLLNDESVTEAPPSPLPNGAPSDQQPNGTVVVPPASNPSKESTFSKTSYFQTSKPIAAF